MNSTLGDLKIRQAILDMDAYLPPLESRDPEKHLLMDFNESPVPPQEKVIQAVSDFLSRRAHVYPAYHDFLTTLSDYTGVAENQLILSNGSDQGIEFILRCFLEHGDELVMAQPGFAMFQQVASSLGAKVAGPSFPESMEFPAEAFKQSVGPATRLLVLINPNNPTGTSISQEVIRDVLENFPNLPVLVDEAYFEFSRQTAAGLLDAFPNLIILRTFSKALALPSLRLGYVMAHPELIQQFSKIRGPFDVNAAAVVAAKVQLENPQEWRSLTRHLMDEVKPTVEAFFRENQVRFHPSSANFMLVEVKDAKEAVEYLKSKGILVRLMHPPLENSFRMSLRRMPEMEQFMSIFKAFLDKRAG
jgi:histidinol-phosphate aminotransferase